MADVDELFRDGGNTPISPIEEEPEGGENYGHNFHDAEEIEHSPVPAKKGNNIAAIIAAGGVGLVMFGFMGFQIYSKIAKKTGGAETYQAVAATPAQQPGDAPPMQNPYEQPASLPASATQPAEPPSIAQTPTEPAPPVAPAAQPALPVTHQAEAPVPVTTAPASVPVITPPIEPSETTAANSKLDKRVDAIESRLGNIEKQITEVAESIKAQKPSIAASGNTPKVKPAQKPAVSKPVAKTNPEEGVAQKNGQYQILSVLAGQAWVEKTSSGDVEIVRVGETLSNGATVTKINSSAGTVVTNRGIIAGK